MTDCDWHHVGMERTVLDTDDIEVVGRIVAELRTALGWSKEHAARRAGISSITWKRVEDGLKVQDTKLSAVLQVLAIQKIDLNGRPIGPIDGDSVGIVTDENSAVEANAQAGVLRSRVKAFGAVLALVPEERQDEALKAAIQPVLAFIDNSESGLSGGPDKQDFALAAHDEDESIAGEQEKLQEP